MHLFGVFFNRLDILIFIPTEAKRKSKKAGRVRIVQRFFPRRAVARNPSARQARARIFVRTSEIVCNTTGIILHLSCTAGAESFQKFFVGEILRDHARQARDEKKTLLQGGVFFQGTLFGPIFGFPTIFQK